MMTLMTTTSTHQSNSNVVLHFNFFSLYPLPCTPFFLHPSLEGSRVLNFLMGKRKPCFIPQDTHQKIYLDNVDGNEVGQAITESHWFSKKRKATCFTIPFLCSLVALHICQGICTWQQTSCQELFQTCDSGYLGSQY